MAYSSIQGLAPWAHPQQHCIHPHDEPGAACFHEAHRGSLRCVVITLACLLCIVKSHRCIRKGQLFMYTAPRMWDMLWWQYLKLSLE